MTSQNPVKYSDELHKNLKFINKLCCGDPNIQNKLNKIDLNLIMNPNKLSQSNNNFVVPYQTYKKNGVIITSDDNYSNNYNCGEKSNSNNIFSSWGSSMGFCFNLT